MKKNKFKILAVITARGNSKRLPKKNIIKLGNKPLILWSIDIAKKINDICDVLVSTDNSDIASIAKNSGAMVPWLRPKRFSTDKSKSVSTVIHALRWYEKHISFIVFNK